MNCTYPKLSVVKLCKDCLYFSDNNDNYPTCSSPEANAGYQTSRTSFLVTGKGRDGGFCSIMRQYDMYCGLEAKYFVPVAPRNIPMYKNSSPWPFLIVLALILIIASVITAYVH